MLRNLSEKLTTKFPATTLSYYMVKIARGNDVFSDIFELEASPVKGQTLPRKIRKGEKGKAKKRRRISQNVIKQGASDKRSHAVMLQMLFPVDGS